TAKDNQWVVLEGLKAGEQVMVDGFQKLQMMPPGSPVKAVPWTKPGTAPAAPAVAAASAPAAAPAASAAK
ncbi:MAG: efflux transporter periplasmic adaptor subunit, partial [Variovorax sp.]